MHEFIYLNLLNIVGSEHHASAELDVVVQELTQRPRVQSPQLVRFYSRQGSLLLQTAFTSPEYHMVSTE